MIPADRTESALDLDLLLGGLKPVVQGLNPQAVNALTNSLIQVLQGQDGNIESLFGKTSAFTNSLADNSQTVQQLIDNLNSVLATIASDGGKFSATVDRLEKLVTGLAGDRDPIGNAITALDTGTASLTDLLTRPGLRWPAPSTSWPGSRRYSIRTRTSLDLALQKAPKKLPQAGSAGVLR